MISLEELQATRPDMHPGLWDVNRELGRFLDENVRPAVVTPETVVSRSQDYLPTAELLALDLVLIDGDWSFPVPFIDWYYTPDKLKVGA